VWSQVKWNEEYNIHNDRNQKINQPKACHGDTRRLGASCLRHTENLQEEDFGKETGQNKTVEPIVINSENSETEDEERDNNDSEITRAWGI
jgi:hypothetical protein